MQKNKTNIPEIALLRGERGGICVTMIIPVSPSLSKANAVCQHRMLRKIKQLLRNNYKPEEINTLIQKLDEMFGAIQYGPGTEGIGLYLSPAVNCTVCFPFSVRERIMISNRFELRELLYKEDFAKPYCVLLLTEQHARLFNGAWNVMHEVKDGHFPLKNDDGYIYTKPAQSSSNAGYAHVKSFEKDKSELEAIRLKDFFRNVDRALDPYLISGRPLIVLAVRKELFLFTDISNHNNSIIGKAEGDYDKTDEKRLTEIAWSLMRNHLEQEHLELLKELDEKTGAGMSIPGVQHTWIAAHEGKGLKLLVEKDYRRPGFLSGDEYHLFLRPPRKTTRILSDAVEDVIETVLDKDGEVHFFENGALRQYDHIAMIARYK